jgi:hypothetical protein
MRDSAHDEYATSDTEHQVTDAAAAEWEAMLDQSSEHDLGLDSWGYPINAHGNRTRVLNQDEIDSLLGFDDPIPFSIKFDLDWRKFLFGVRFKWHVILIYPFPFVEIKITLPHPHP